MKNLLYFMVILFNAFGAVFSISLFFLLNPFYFQYLPLIFLSTLIFIISMTVTTKEFCKKRNKIIITSHDNNLIDYKEYFKTRKDEFKIAG